jgi:hypothetical protein
VDAFTARASRRKTEALASATAAANGVVWSPRRSDRLLHPLLKPALLHPLLLQVVACTLLRNTTSNTALPFSIIAQQKRTVGNSGIVGQGFFV